MSHVHIERLSAVFNEYIAVQTAVTQSLMNPSQEGFRYMIRAEQNLETTYTIRIFVEFEGILRIVLLDHDPRRRVAREAYNRINRAARLFAIPDTVRDAVHEAREYRNSIVHPDGLHVDALAISEARSDLNRFLKPLP